MSHLNALKTAANLTDVAKILGVKPAGLSYVLFKKGAANNYAQFTIPKRYGGTRTISAPTDQLKMIQERLSNVLQNCIEEINNVNQLKAQIAHGFIRKRSILTNAQAHRKRRYVFNMDLENFFGAINFGRIRGFFIKDRHFALPPPVATVLAQIVCYNNSLPQGSPCSPVVSNLIGHVLDVQLVRIAKREGCTFTRYADDLTFSTNKPIFPVSIAVPVAGQPNIWQVGTGLARIITKSGFTVNSAKTRMQYRDSRQEVTGLIVNQKINVRYEYRHTVRAMVQRLVKTGAFQHTRYVIDPSGALVRQDVPGTAEELRGMLNFIDGIDLYNKSVGQEDDDGNAQDKLSSKETLYRRFLLFNEFYAAPRPVLMCEGHTDNVYLVHAIRSLSGTFPTLATLNTDGTIKLNVRLLKYSGHGLGRVLGISGGSANLAKFVWLYEKARKTFSAPGMKQPIILVIDNDSGAKSVYKSVSTIIGKQPTGAEPSIHVAGNLYVVPTPLSPGKKQSAIEDCFDSATKSVVIGGKTFDAGNDTDSATQYGKVVFAHKVVRAHAGTINFSGFNALLSNIRDVIDTHAKSHP
jgi:RNA-directed DNA polymerase